MQYEFKESDWKLFRKQLPKWQEDFMDKLNHEYIDLLNGNGQASDKFWSLEKRIKEDKKNTGVICRDMRRSDLFFDIVELVSEGAITIEDLSDFSPELRDAVKGRMAMNWD